MPNTNSVERQGLSIAEACEIAGVGKTKLYQAIKERKLRARKLGTRTIILRADLQKFLASLPTAA